MAKYCLFRVEGNGVEYVETTYDYALCDKSCEYLNELAIMNNVDTRYIMRKLDDWEDPHTYECYPNVIYIKH